jgi:hypothetical protein
MDVRRFGLLSAGTVVDRYTALVDRFLTGGFPEPPVGPGSHAPSDAARRGMEALLRLLDSAAALVGAGSGPGATTETLALLPTPPGGTAELTLWVHNGMSSAVPGVVVRVTDLVSATGRTVPAAAVSLTPDRADLPAAGAQEVRLAVRVPPDQAPAHYLGLVLASASPTQPMLLRLEVRP